MAAPRTNNGSKLAQAVLYPRAIAREKRSSNFSSKPSEASLRISGGNHYAVPAHGWLRSPASFMLVLNATLLGGIDLAAECA